MAALERIDALALVPRPGAPSIAYVFAHDGGDEEIYVLKEAQALLGLGREVRLYPFPARECAETLADLGPLSSRVRNRARLSPRFIRGGLVFALRHPVLWCKAAWGLFATLWRHPLALFRALLHFPLLLAFSRNMQREGVAHIHAHAANGGKDELSRDPILGAWLIHRLTGIPLSIASYGPVPARAVCALGSRLGRVSFAIVGSELNRRALSDLACTEMESKLKVMCRGVDLGSFPDRSIREGQVDHGGSGQPLQVVCVTNLNQADGPRVLLQALALLARHAVPFRCRFLGDGAKRKALESQVITLGLVGKVQFLGSQSASAVRDELLRADAFVQVAGDDSEEQAAAVPISMLEAMACACPLVATASLGAPELIANGVEGLLIPMRNPDALALALTRLWENPELRLQMGQAGRARIASEHDLEICAKRLAELFDASLGKRPTKRPPRPRLVAS